MSSRNLNRRSRGQAAVELSLLTIIIVPTTLYVLFLDDMLRFKLDQQEAIVTTLWDLGVMDWEDGNKGAKNVSGAVQTYNRYAFGDHNVVDSRYDDLNAINDDKRHHLAIGAHQCWLVGGAGNQVTCGGRDPGVGATFFPDLAPGAQKATQNAAQTGGYYSCTGRIGVINNWLPPETLMQFSKEKLTRTNYHHDPYTKVHDTGATYGDDDRGVYHFPADTFSVVTDTWAMTQYPAVSPDAQSGILYNRVAASYRRLAVKALMTPAAVFPVLLGARNLANPLIATGNSQRGDNVYTPQVAFTKNMPNPTANPYNPYFASAWQDWGSDRVKGTHSARKNEYMGLPAP